MLPSEAHNRAGHLPAGAFPLQGNPLHKRYGVSASSRAASMTRAQGYSFGRP